MRLNDFVNVDEVVELGIVEFKKRSYAPTINWVPSRQNVYMSQCKKYSSLLLSIASSASESDIKESNMNPSQFIKAAQDFQLSARLSGMDKNVIIKNFMKLANIGMALKRYYYNLYSQKVNNIELFKDCEVINKVNQLNGLLRAFSETIYFDDHTVSGEFYGELYKEDKLVVVRSYKRLCPSDFLDEFNDFKIDRIETFCQYKNDGLDFDCLGNIQYINQMRPEICGFYGECFLKNGECLTLKDQSSINYVIENIEIQLKKVLELFFSSSKSTQEHLLLKSAYYAFKPILEKIGLNWYPSDSDILLYTESLSKKTEFDKVSEKSRVIEDRNNMNIQRIVDPRFSI